MKRLFLLLFLLSGLACAQMTEYRHSVYTLFSITDDGGMSMHCTSTAISTQKTKDKYEIIFMTSAHCISDLDDYYLSEGESAVKEFYPAEILFADKEDDVAGLRIVTNYYVKPVPLGKDPKDSDDQQVVSVVNSLGLGKQILHGYVSRTDWNDYLLLQMSGVSPGASGSGLYCTEQQALCGIINSIIKDTQVATKISKFNKLFQDWLSSKDKDVYDVHR